ncbi:MAG: PAS domain-containing protein [Myxococcales bacterium]|jgi:PAS domain S-box-containing protein
MTARTLNLLLAENDPAHVEAVQQAYREIGSRTKIRVAASLNELRHLAAIEPPDIALLDLSLREGPALALTGAPNARRFPVIVLTGAGDEQSAAEATKAGALDYVVKSPEAFRALPRTVDRALREWNLREAARQAEARNQHLNAVLRGIRSVNQLITRERNPEVLIRRACELLVESRGFDACCIVVCEGEELKHFASAGLDARLVRLREMLVRRELPDCARRALRGAGPVVRRDPAQACRDCPASKNWPADRDAAVLGLEIGDRVFGALMVALPSCADEIELDLLREVAGDVAFALDSIEAQAEREQAIEAFVRSQAAYHELVANLEDVVISTDLRGRIEYISPAIERVYGRAPHEAIGRKFIDFVHPDDVPAVAASFERTLSGSIEPHEFRGFDKQGRVRYLRVKCRLRMEQGRPVGVDGVIVDLTERRRAEDAERESLRAHSVLLGNLPGMAYRCRNERGWTMELVSEGCLELTGHSPEDLIGNAKVSFEDLIHPDDRERVWNEVQAGVAQGRRFGIEYRLRTASGETRWVSETGTPVTGPSGELVALEGFVTDVSTRKRAEQQACDLNDRLLRLARVLRDLAATRSIEAVKTIVRKAARDLVNSEVAAFVLYENERCLCATDCALAQSEGRGVEALSKRSSAWVIRERRPLVVEDLDSDGRIPREASRDTAIKSLLMVPMNGGKLAGAIGSYWTSPHRASQEDIRILQALADSTSVAMENLRVLAELEKGGQRVRALYDYLPNAALVWRREAHGFVLADFNATARTLLEGGTAQHVGKSLQELAASFPHLEQDVASCFESRATVRREVECGRPGARNPLRLVLTYGFIPSDMVILHVEDLTKQRQTEKQLQLSQRLEAVGRLAGGVAHDFNNLLSVILSYADFALADLRESDPIRADLLEIKNAAERAAALTGQLLAFSRKQVREPQVLNINTTVTGIENMLRRLLGEDIQILVCLAEDLGSVEADPGQLEQVIMNLAVNARDAMPRGGKLTIETANVELDDAYARMHVAIKPGNYVLLSVTDTGCGMDAATREHIFEPFFTTKESKGTGLGLATVYGIVKQSGGNIWVYSERGQGTTFKVYLPRVDLPATETRRRSPAVIAPGTETVLVVEDESAVRKLVERILRLAGYRVLSGANGGEALLLCEKHGDKIDLLLTDVVMPQMSGRELAERLALLSPQLKVLYMSGYTNHAIVHHGVLEPGTRFIGKPFSAPELTYKVREALDASDSRVLTVKTRQHAAESIGGPARILKAS